MHINKSLKLLYFLGFMVFISFISMLISLKVGMYLLTFSTISFLLLALGIVFNSISPIKASEIIMKQAILSYKEGEYFKTCIFGIASPMIIIGLFVFFIILQFMIVNLKSI